MISVNDRKAIWTGENRVQYECAEALIDQAIRDSEDDTILVDVSSATISKRVIERLCEAYREGGWIVSVVPVDGREPGLFLELRAAGVPRSGPGVG
jgi:hypothetical protein